MMNSFSTNRFIIFLSLATWLLTSCSLKVLSSKDKHVLTDIALETLVPTYSAGDLMSLRVTVKNDSGEVIPTYSGTIHFSSTDLAATLPSDYQFVPSDLGVHEFTGIAFKTIGTQSITVTDMRTHSVISTAGPFDIGPSSQVSSILLSVTGNNPIIADGQDTTQLQAVITDLYGNPYKNQLVHLSLPSNGGGTSDVTTNDSGVAQFTLSSSTVSGNYDYMITIGPTTSNTASITFKHGAADHLLFQNLQNALDGISLSQQPQISVVDAFDNLVTSGPDATAKISLSVFNGTNVLHSGLSSCLSNPASCEQYATGGLANFSNMSILGTFSNFKLQAQKADTQSQNGGTPSSLGISNAISVFACNSGTTCPGCWTFTTAGTSTWTVPSNWNSAVSSIEAIGGGGGGAYAKIINHPLTVGATLSVNIGSGGGGGAVYGGGGFGGDTWFLNSTTLLAKGGNGGDNCNTLALGGSSATSIGAIKYSGGAGGGGTDDPTYTGGGGGGAGGQSRVGQSGVGITGGVGGGGTASLHVKSGTGGNANPSYSLPSSLGIGAGAGGAAGPYMIPGINGNDGAVVIKCN